MNQTPDLEFLKFYTCMSSIQSLHLSVHAINHMQIFLDIKMFVWYNPTFHI